MNAFFRRCFDFRRKAMQSAIGVILAFLLSWVSVQPAWAGSDVKNAVVKIYTVSNGYDYYEPWQKRGQVSGSGSGCIIDGKRILTNAHVVANQTFIQVRRAGEAKKYTAEVEVVAHECDLAVLKVNDDSFFSEVKPIDIGSLAEIRDKVAVYGFPEGGDKLSITEGVVSRVENHKYTHSRAELLACQIDAAINSGNSGGPVMKGDKLVGVAFQSMSGGDAENIGYMVPTPIVEHFLTDIRDGKYDGIPDLGIAWQDMENPDIKNKYTMTAQQTGVLVNNVYPDSPAKGILQTEDIILSIDGKTVENDGTIEFRDGERTSFDYQVQEKYINDTLELAVLRKNKIISLGVKLSKPSHDLRLVPYEEYDVAPTYYILGGLVFQPLTVNFLKLWGNKWYHEASKNLLYQYYYGQPTEDKREIVVLSKVLADEINVGYHNLHDRIVYYVNGKRIASISDLVKAFESCRGKYHIIVDEMGSRIVLDRQKVRENGPVILKKYGINSDRSKDLEQL
jgi:S1-C subfamily serine protease